MSNFSSCCSPDFCLRLGKALQTCSTSRFSSTSPGLFLCFRGCRLTEWVRLCGCGLLLKLATAVYLCCLGLGGDSSGVWVGLRGGLWGKEVFLGLLMPKEMLSRWYCLESLYLGGVGGRLRLSEPCPWYINIIIGCWRYYQGSLCHEPLKLTIVHSLLHPVFAEERLVPLLLLQVEPLVGQLPVHFHHSLPLHPLPMQSRHVDAPPPIQPLPLTFLLLVDGEKVPQLVVAGDYSGVGLVAGLRGQQPGYALSLGVRRRLRLRGDWAGSEGERLVESASSRAIMQIRDVFLVDRSQLMIHILKKL